jgi:predicted kinase
VAERLQTNFSVIECRCPEDILKGRLENRLSEKGEASDGRWEIYQAQKNDFDPINEFLPDEHLVVNTTVSPDICVNQILQKIRGIECHHLK